MKIGIPAQEPTTDSTVETRFGRTRYFMIYDDRSSVWETIDNIHNMNASQGAGIQSASTVVNAGCMVLLCSHCGPKAFAVLTRAGVSVYTVGNGSVQHALDSFKQGALKKMESADVEGHW
ncbi:MAG: NifB/NifX family molybdenum-iron cluster-binding protein [Chitinivibrionales bacterium]|nr:NifB/NifX family molybdenum-iron cluster-binding protein [Chitinivibrionales bacterium]